MKKIVFSILAIALAFGSLSVVQAQTATAADCVQINSTVKTGSRGTAVLKLQNFLIAKGYETVLATGYFGSLTKQALIDFQQQNGVEAVGSAGPVTRGIIAKVSGCEAVTVNEVRNGKYSIQIVSPSASDVAWRKGKTAVVRWKGENLDGLPVAIFLVSATTTPETARTKFVVASIANGKNNNEETVKLPTDIPSGKYLLRISVDLPNSTYTGVVGETVIEVKGSDDDVASILPTIEITSPASTTVWSKDTAGNITWKKTKSGLLPKINIFLVNQITNKVYPVRTGVSNDGVAIVTVDMLKDIPVGKYKILINGLYGSVVIRDASEEFTLVQKAGQTAVVPTITSVTASNAPLVRGGQVKVIGTGFTTNDNDITLINAATKATTTRAVVGIPSSDKTTLYFNFPSVLCSQGAACSNTALAATGTYNVLVTNKGGQSNAGSIVLADGTLPANTATYLRNIQFTNGATLQKGSEKAFTWETNGLGSMRVDFLLSTSTSAGVKIYTLKSNRVNDTRGSIGATELEGVPVGPYTFVVRGINKGEEVRTTVPVTVYAKTAIPPTVAQVTGSLSNVVLSTPTRVLTLGTQAHKVTWSSVGIPTSQKVDVALVREGSGSAVSLAKVDGTTASFTFSIADIKAKSSTMAVPGSYRIVITASSTVNAKSDVFTIEEPKVTFKTPASNTEFAKGSVVNFTWSTNLGTERTIDIVLKGVTDTAYRSVIRSAAENDGVGKFTLPSDAKAGTYVIRLRTSFAGEETVLGDLAIRVKAENR